MVDVEDFRSSVVVGYDGSAQAIAAVHWAAAEATRRGEALVVLHAMDFGALMVGPAVDSLVPQESKQYGEIMTEEAAAQARKAFPELTVRRAALMGGAAASLIQASEAASLVVVGTRGHGQVVGMLLGSVAFQVATHSQSPVVVVRGGSSQLPGPGRPVVVGTDGSEASEPALDEAATYAASVGAGLQIVTAWSVRGTESWASAWASVYIGDLHPGKDPEQALQEAAEAVLTAARERVLRAYPDLPVSTRAGRGTPVDVLAEASADAGLLVVGARGRGGFASLVLGSVSRAVIHTAHCPVAVIREQ